MKVRLEWKLSSIFQVNSHSFSAFANTISFNVSRYPTLVEMTNSKDYEKQKSLNTAKETSKDTKDSTNDALKTVKQTSSSDSNLEYVPAEYFRGAENGSIQTGIRVNKFFPLTKFDLTIS